MTKEEIKKLGSLSRIALSEAEIESFRSEIDSILEYVSVVKDIVSDTSSEPSVGARFNVLREDAVTVEPGSFTEVMLEAMPKTDGQFLSVKKILKQSD